MINPTTSAKSSKRFDSIDALRGIAAIMVMVLHVGQAFLNAPKVKASGRGLLQFYQYVDLGRIGITIFFIISGFVICKSFNNNEKELKSFVIKRFYRLYPLFWFSMLLAAVVIWLPSSRNLTLGIFLANISMVPAFFRQEFMVGLYWTLETELIFYLLMSLLFVAGLLRRQLVMILVTIFLFALIIYFQYFSGLQAALPHWQATPYHLSLMLMGVSFRYAYDNEMTAGRLEDFLSTKSMAIIHLAILLIVPVYLVYRYFGFGEMLLLQDAVAYLAGITIFILGIMLLRGASSIVVYLGVISYSVYLLHPMVFTLVLRLAKNISFLQGWHVSIYIIMCSFLTIILSHFTYQWIEKKFNDLGRKKARKYLT